MQNKKQIISTAVSVLVSTLLVAGVVFAVTTISGTTVTLENLETITNATDTQISLVGAGELTTARVGLLKAGFNGYGSELGGSGLNPVTITTTTGIRAGAELYYGYSGTSGVMRGLRLLMDSEATTGTVSELKGAEISVRGSTAGGVTISNATALTAGVLPKQEGGNDTITTAIGVQSVLDLQSAGSNTVTTWKAFDVKLDNPDTPGTITDAYGLYFEDSTAGKMTADIRLSNGATIINRTDGGVEIGDTTSTTADGTAGLDVWIDQADATALTGTLKGAYIQALNGDADASASGVVRGIEVKAKAGGALKTLEGISLSSDTKGANVSTQRGIEISLDAGEVGGGTATLAQGLLISNNSSGAQTTSYALDINSGITTNTPGVHKVFTADIRLQNGETIDNATDGLIAIVSDRITQTSAIDATGTSAENAFALTVTDTSDISGNINRGIFVDYTHQTNAITYSGQINGMGIDLAVKKDVYEAYDLALYSSSTDNPTVNIQSALSIYMDDPGDNVAT